MSKFSMILILVLLFHGAALHGYELMNGAKNLLLDVTPLSLGIVMGGLMEKIISETTIPIVKRTIPQHTENGQTAIKITILQGERETSKNNRTLGKFILSGIEPKSGNTENKGWFCIRCRRYSFVSTGDESTGEEKHVVVKTDDGLNIKDMRDIVESSIKNAKDDILRMLIESKLRLEDFK